MDQKELLRLLEAAQDVPVSHVDLSANAKRIKVDMDTRKITGYTEFGVIGEHLAENIIFEVKRYKGDTDLAEKHCAIHWENGENGGVLPVTEVDLSEDGHILMRWELSDEFTQYSGDITYALHFFNILDGGFTYHAATYAEHGKLGRTLNASAHSRNKITPSEIEVYIAKMNELSAEIDRKIASFDISDKITSPKTAEIGQVLAVKAVDDSGKPTEWDVVNMASGGGEDTSWMDEPVLRIEVAEESNYIYINEINGEPFEFEEMAGRFELQGITGNSDGRLCFAPKLITGSYKGLIIANTNSSKDNIQKGVFFIKKDSIHGWYTECTSGAANTWVSGVSEVRRHNSFAQPADNARPFKDVVGGIKEFTLIPYTGTFHVGSVIEIYGKPVKKEVGA